MSKQDNWKESDEKELEVFHSCYQNTMEKLDDPTITYTDILELYNTLTQILPVNNKEALCSVCSFWNRTS